MKVNKFLKEDWQVTGFSDPEPEREFWHELEKERPIVWVKLYTKTKSHFAYWIPSEIQKTLEQPFAQTLAGSCVCVCPGDVRSVILENVSKMPT